MSLGVIGGDLDGALEARHGVIGPAFPVIEVAEVVMGLGEAGVDLERALEGFNGLGRVPLLLDEIRCRSGVLSAVSG